TSFSRDWSSDVCSSDLWSSMGVGLHYQTTQSLINITDFGMSVEQAVNAPRLLLPISPDGSDKGLILRVVEGEFPDAVLDGTGLEIGRASCREGVESGGE